jgi:DNA-binding PadR family transcriptional regulator
MNKNLFRGALLEAVLLSLIRESSSRGLHGYALFDAVKKRFGVSLGPSTLYPELKLLEHRGLIVSRWDFTTGKARCIYSITNKGQNLLQEYSVQLKVVVPALAVRNLS